MYVIGDNDGNNNKYYSYINKISIVLDQVNSTF